MILGNVHNSRLSQEEQAVTYWQTNGKVKVGNDQEVAQSERNSHSKNRSEKKTNKLTCTKKT